MAKSVHAAVENDAFWCWVAILLEITTLCHKNRSWGLGCPCHQNECKEHAARSKIYRCPQGRKSMNGPWLHTQMRCAVSTFSSTMSELAAQERFASKPDLKNTIRNATEILQAACSLKFGFCDMSPWIIWRVRNEPAIALRFLAEFDTASDPTKLHRIHQRFCSTPLRAHMEVKAQTNNNIPTLFKTPLSICFA
eukprot:6478369-Amphidinium_carterae.1